MLKIKTWVSNLVSGLFRIHNFSQHFMLLTGDGGEHGWERGTSCKHALLWFDRFSVSKLSDKLSHKTSLVPFITDLEHILTSIMLNWTMKDIENIFYTILFVKQIGNCEEQRFRKQRQTEWQIRRWWTGDFLGGLKLRHVSHRIKKFVSTRSTVDARTEKNFFFLELFTTTQHVSTENLSYNTGWALRLTSRVVNGVGTILNRQW